MILLLSET